LASGRLKPAAGPAADKPALRTSQTLAPSSSSGRLKGAIPQTRRHSITETHASAAAVAARAQEEGRPLGRRKRGVRPSGRRVTVLAAVRGGENHEEAARRVHRERHERARRARAREKARRDRREQRAQRRGIDTERMQNEREAAEALMAAAEEARKLKEAERQRKLALAKAMQAKQDAIRKMEAERRKRKLEAVDESEEALRREAEQQQQLEEAYAAFEAQQREAEKGKRAANRRLREHRKKLKKQREREMNG